MKESSSDNKRGKKVEFCPEFYKSVRQRGINWSPEDASSHHPADTQAETCCSLPRTRAICSTDCTETHTASTAATLMGEGVAGGSATASGLSHLYVLTAFSRSCWLGSIGSPANNLIICSEWHFTVSLATREKQGERERKAQTIFSCLCLTDEGWTLLTLSGRRDGE